MRLQYLHSIREDFLKGSEEKKRRGLACKTEGKER